MDEYARLDLQKEWQNKLLKSFAKEHRKSSPLLKVKKMMTQLIINIQKMDTKQN
ncbi:hypothetical protein [Apibacter adventoris]|uniref:hypothetical protein n=1 Tax=Apibacter adventoris TaxID=1679466 RepID=UPI0015E2912D|nr:hypothetical protein [Apibacter adventoris]